MTQSEQQHETTNGLCPQCGDRINSDYLVQDRAWHRGVEFSTNCPHCGAVLTARLRNVPQITLTRKPGPKFRPYTMTELAAVWETGRGNRTKRDGLDSWVYWLSPGVVTLYEFAESVMYPVITYYEFLDQCTWPDGTPCGVEVV